MARTNNQLLVSVRTADEAEAALAGGADLIDIKEPVHGSLGKASDAVISEIVTKVAGRRPVSAAMGELIDTVEPLSRVLPDGTWEVTFPTSSRQHRLSFLKWGLSHCQHIAWQSLLELRIVAVQKSTSARVVTVAYADWQLAGSPTIDAVVAFVCRRPGSVLLVDTFTKLQGTTLLSYLSFEKLRMICQLCRKHRVRIALAGALGIEEIEYLLPLHPDWFAVRTAACEDGRTSTISEQKVRQLANLLQKVPMIAG